MTGPRYDAEDVRAELRAGDILDWYGVRYRRSGREYRLSECPRCGPWKRESFSARATGPYRCCHGGHAGDLLELVALFEGLSVRRDFQRVLAVAAEIARVPPRDTTMTREERERRRAEAARRRREEERRRAEEERQKFERAHETAAEVWDGLRLRNRPGEAYLRERGLGALLERDDREELVRFDERGTVRLPLYDEHGRIVNVPGRYLPGRERGDAHILNVTGCVQRGTFGHPDDLLFFEGPVVIVEGIFDYLSGLVFWPARAVFGAHGKDQIPTVARVIANRIANDDRELVFVPHQDAPGLDAVRKAVRAAVDAGMPRAKIKALDVSAAGNDLNDWLRASQNMEAKK